tara:strand:- start:1168 stop:1509 length:342 start_codon:yes stop_codon:yes gene_type:complete
MTSLAMSMYLWVILILLGRRAVLLGLASGQDILLESALILVAPLLLAEHVVVEQPAAKWWSLVAVGNPAWKREALLLDITQQDANRDAAILAAGPLEYWCCALVLSVSALEIS